MLDWWFVLSSVGVPASTEDHTRGIYKSDITNHWVKHVGLIIKLDINGYLCDFKYIHHALNVVICLNGLL